MSKKRLTKQQKITKEKVLAGKWNELDYCTSQECDKKKKGICKSCYGGYIYYG